MTENECRRRKVQTALKVNEVDIARRTLLDAQNDKDFEIWMLENGIYEQFIHEAFVNNNFHFFADLLLNLPRDFFRNRFLDSKSFVNFAMQWITSRPTETMMKLNMYSLIDNTKSGRFNLKKIRNWQKMDENKKSKHLKSIISDTLFKLGIDLDLENIEGIDYYCRPV